MARSTSNPTSNAEFHDKVGCLSGTHVELYLAKEKKKWTRPWGEVCVHVFCNSHKNPLLNFDSAK